jgi:beta-fructofuranosidase
MYLHKIYTITLIFSLLLSVKSVAQTPIAHWHFDENAGLMTKENNSQINFVINNQFPKSESERVNGVKNNALRFNGYATWVEGNLTTTLPSNEMTISAWVAPEVYPMSSAPFFTNISSNSGAYLGIDKFGRLEIGVNTNGFFNQKISTEKIALWEWSHVTLTINTTEGKIRGYINGVLVAEQNIPTIPLIWASPNSVKIGKHTAKTVSGIYETGLFCGLIDEVKIFETTLSTTQLATAFSKEKPSKLPDMSIPKSRFEGDIHRPIFHAIPPANWMNEPHGLIFFNNLYHIFYQKNGNGPYWGRLNWGHQTSPDLVTWTEQKVVLTPDAGSYDREGCWSGASMQDNGKAYIMYTGVDGGSAQMCIAEGIGDLSTYQKITNNPVVSIPPAPYTNNDFRDPYLWKENGIWYMTIGSGLGGSGNSGGAALLYKSTDLFTWKYLNVLYKGYPQSDKSGIFWELPMLLNFGEKRVLTAQPVPEAGVPARILYWTGTFENEIFKADTTQPKLLEPGDNLLGVTTTTDPNGKTIAIGIVPDNLLPSVQQQKGWANLMSLPRVWSLSADGCNLLQKPLPALEKLRGKNHHFDNLSIVAGQSNFLPSVAGRHIEIRAKIEAGTASRVGLVVAKSPDNAERTRIYWDIPFGIFQIERSNSSSNINTPKSSSSTILNISSGQLLDLHVFYDGSILEVFINEEKALSTRIYPEKMESIGLDFFAQGGTAKVQSVDIWEMKNMYDKTLFISENDTAKPTNVIENIYPNPNDGTFFLDLNLRENTKTDLKIFDVNGKNIYIKNLENQVFGKQTIALNTEKITPGVYIIQIYSDGILAGVKKIIIQ